MAVGEKEAHILAYLFSPVITELAVRANDADGSWLYVADHASMPLPAPAPEK
ncbi:MAG: hypothetical protein ACREO9_01655 [Lysobacterales bacterium]